MLVFFIAVSGVTLFFDYMIYVWGEAYQYDPGIIKGKYDSHIGAIVNGLVLPGAALLYIVYRGKWVWSVVLAACFAGIEVFFISTDIYRPMWWRPWYTFPILIFYFPVVRHWWERLGRSPEKWVMFGTLLSVFYGVFVPLNIGLYGVLQIRSFHVHWIEQMGRDSSAFNTLTALFFGVILAGIGTFRLSKLWSYFAVGWFIAYNRFLIYIGIVRTENLLMDFVLSMIIFFLAMFCVRYAEKRLFEYKQV
ncbi:hypothetical protein [Brevibacillus dissolubilis]|uniref:hypothetical protein n=1 Tax=Brevibacillus dissolubilis TaxID=1844116 RepID=UPI00111791B0|nr:hypothetical protein [Brevibacillus dissolubilis]